jgi:hypothetical protein
LKQSIPSKKIAQPAVSSAPAPILPPLARKPYIAFAVAALILIFFIQALAESRYKSPTSDEPPHIASGLSYVSTGIFRANLQHPPLLKELAGLSLLLGGIRWPHNKETEFLLHGNLPKGAQPDWNIGNGIIANSGPDRVLFWARLPFLFISALLGILIYLWGRQLLGGLAALGAVLLYTTDPTVLSHSYLVTMDIGLTAFTVAFLFALWRYLQNPTWQRLLFCGLALGAVLGAKFSAVFLLPVAGVLLCSALVWPAEQEAGRKRTVLDPYYREETDVQSFPLATFARRDAGRNDPCPCGSGKKYKACHGDPAKSSLPIDRLREKWPLCCGIFLIMLAVAAVVIQCLYFFSKDPFLYVRGLLLVNADHRTTYLAYMAGALQHRFLSYFAVAYLLKEPLAGMILTVLGLVVLIRSSSITFLQKLFLLLPAAVMFIAPTLWAEDIGIRYILPVLPFAHLLGGLGLATLFTTWGKWGR